MSSAITQPYTSTISVSDTSSCDNLTYTYTYPPHQSTNSTFNSSYDFGVAAVEVHVVHIEDGKVVRTKTVTFKPENILEFKKEYPENVIILTECDLAEVILAWS